MTEYSSTDANVLYFVCNYPPSPTQPASHPVSVFSCALGTSHKGRRKSSSSSSSSYCCSCCCYSFHIQTICCCNDYHKYSLQTPNTDNFAPQPQFVITCAFCSRGYVVHIYDFVSHTTVKQTCVSSGVRHLLRPA